MTDQDKALAVLKRLANLVHKKLEIAKADADLGKPLTERQSTQSVLMEMKLVLTDELFKLMIE